MLLCKRIHLWLKWRDSIRQYLNNMEPDQLWLDLEGCNAESPIHCTSKKTQKNDKTKHIHSSWISLRRWIKYFWIELRDATSTWMPDVLVEVRRAVDHKGTVTKLLCSYATCCQTWGQCFSSISHLGKMRQTPVPMTLIFMVWHNITSEASRSALKLLQLLFSWMLYFFSLCLSVFFCDFWQESLNTDVWCYIDMQLLGFWTSAPSTTALILTQ